jgi:hypothetical protein
VAACERNRTPPGLGPQTSAEAIERAQAKRLNSLDPYSIQQGQRVHFVESQEVISSQGPIKAYTKEWITEVTNVENNPETRILTTYKSVTDKTWDEDFVYIFKGTYFLQQLDALTLLDQLEDRRFYPSSVLQQLEKRSEQGTIEVEGIALHNLQEQSVSIVPPELVKNAKNCKNIVGCRIQGEQISYDVVFLMSDGSTQTHRVEWLFSAEVPYFAAILKQCSTSVFPIDNLRVLVKQCSEVVNFDETGESSNPD